MRSTVVVPTSFLADAEPLATTYSREFYERMGVPVAAELDRPD